MCLRKLKIKLKQYFCIHDYQFTIASFKIDFGENGNIVRQYHYEHCPYCGKSIYVVENNNYQYGSLKELLTAYYKRGKVKHSYIANNNLHRGDIVTTAGGLDLGWVESVKPSGVPYVKSRTGNYYPFDSCKWYYTGVHTAFDSWIEYNEYYKSKM